MSETAQEGCADPSVGQRKACFGNLLHPFPLIAHAVTPSIVILHLLAVFMVTQTPVLASPKPLLADCFTSFYRQCIELQLKSAFHESSKHNVGDIVSGGREKHQDAMSIEMQESTPKPESDGQSPVLITQTCYRLLCACQKQLNNAVLLNFRNRQDI